MVLLKILEEKCCKKGEHRYKSAEIKAILGDLYGQTVINKAYDGKLRNFKQENKKNQNTSRKTRRKIIDIESQVLKNNSRQIKEEENTQPTQWNSQPKTVDFGFNQPNKNKGLPNDESNDDEYIRVGDSEEEEKGIESISQHYHEE